MESKENIDVYDRVADRVFFDAINSIEPDSLEQWLQNMKRRIKENSYSSEGAKLIAAKVVERFRYNNYLSIVYMRYSIPLLEYQPVIVWSKN